MEVKINPFKYKKSKRIYAFWYKGNENSIKIGDSRESKEKRIGKEVGTAGLSQDVEKKYLGNAIFEDQKLFRDTDFHAWLKRCGYKVDRSKLKDSNDERSAGREWFIIPGGIKQLVLLFSDFIGKKLPESAGNSQGYELRSEQKKVVKQTAEYFKNHENGKFLWACKPRFGKTLTAYDLCLNSIPAENEHAKNILILTNRPAISASWYSDYENFFGPSSGYHFISRAESIKENPDVISRKEYASLLDKGKGCIEFVSLQDAKGSRYLYSEGQYDKLPELANLYWDVVIIDESHEGVDTRETEIVLNHIKRRYTLYLSGTPFKALEEGKFNDDNVFYWTYQDEQKAKKDWGGNPDENPYMKFPTLNLFAYQMSEAMGVKLSEDFEDEKFFNLNEFFKTENGHFVNDSDVDHFLDLLTTNKGYPFSEEYRKKLQHTLWMLETIESAKALEKKLERHPVFKDYKVVMAVGKEWDSPEENAKTALDAVTRAIEKNQRTITLSVGQLTTGVTVPQWTAILMLSNMASASEYMQAAFRVQNPWDKGVEENEEHEYVDAQKEDCYIFDFAPSRSLKFINTIANAFRPPKNSEEREKNVKELIGFLPVVSQDDDGHMQELDAEKVLTLPLHIEAKEVMERGFMSSLLFPGISFAPGSVITPEVAKILEKFPAEKSTRGKSNSNAIQEAIEVNNNGELLKTQGLKIPALNPPEMQKVKDPEALSIQQLANELATDPTKVIQDYVQNIMEINNSKTYRTALKNFAKEKLNQIEANSSKTANEMKLAAREGNPKGVEDQEKAFQLEMKEVLTEIPTEVENTLKEAEKKNIEKMASKEVTARLKGFARTIPAFLMAYGNKDTTLESFSKIVPENEFEEVTTINYREFNEIRPLINSSLFDQSVKEFFDKKEQLANWFDESQAIDIFSYIPSQTTNLIFTPRTLVKEMVRDIEEESNEKIFDMDSITFADPCMKSGMYITEIVKRLYNSKKMREKYPDDEERLRHIFEKQVYGLAPTHTTYLVAMNYIFGSPKTKNINKSHFREFDILKFTEGQKGKKQTANVVEEKLNEIFGA